MKKLIAILALVFASAAQAGDNGFSTLTISWTGGSTPVPTLSNAAILGLATLLALLAYRASRNSSNVVRALAPLVTFGLASFLTVISGKPEAGAGLGTTVYAGSCNGSTTYTADDPNPPPCFVNTCGSPVSVSYTLVSAQDPGGEEIAPEACTYDYYCEGDVPTAGAATPGATIPSDGLPYATAYCAEQFGDGGIG